MNDFKSYTQSGNNGKKNQTGATGATGAPGATGAGSGSATGATAAGSGGSANYNQTVNMAAMMAKAFNGKSEGQILQTIIAQAEQGKREGTLTNADLDNFYNTLAPLLDGFKRQKLRQIIQKLKSI